MWKTTGELLCTRNLKQSKSLILSPCRCKKILWDMLVLRILEKQFQRAFTFVPVNGKLN